MQKNTKKNQQNSLRKYSTIQVYDHAQEEEKRREAAEKLAETFKESLFKEKDVIQ